MSILLNGTNQFVRTNVSATATNGLTIICSFNQTASTTNDRTLVWQSVGNSFNRNNWGLRVLSNGMLRFVFRNAANTGYAVWDTPSAVSAGEWYTVAFVHSFGNSASTACYVNGSALTGTWAFGSGNEAPYTLDNVNVHIGIRDEIADRFNGMIAHVMVALSYLPSADCLTITAGARAYAWVHGRVGPTDIKVLTPLATQAGGFDSNHVPGAPALTHLNAPVIGTSDPPVVPQITPRWAILPDLYLAGSAGASAATMTAFLELLVSGASVVNAIGHTDLTLSAHWVVSDGTGSYTYEWSFAGGVSNEAGFVSLVSGVSAVTRTFSLGGGTLERRLLSTTVSDASGTSITSSVLIHPRARQTPAEYDGAFVGESQARRRIYPN